MSRPPRALAMLLVLAACTLARPLAGAPNATRVSAPGLSAPASVTTDRWGIPHVRAASLDDLYYAWGWVSARDRLWQMVWTRTAADGQTHRWLGNDALRADAGAQLFRIVTSFLAAQLVLQKSQAFTKHKDLFRVFFRAEPLHDYCGRIVKASSAEFFVHSGQLPDQLIEV